MKRSFACKFNRSLIFSLIMLLHVLFPMRVLAIGHHYVVKDINPNGDAIERYVVNPFAVLGNAVIFAANDGSSGTELWRTDGIASGTYLLKDINPGVTGSNPLFFTPFNGKIIFRATDPVNGNELRVTDGTAEGTQLLADINPGAANSHPQKLTVVGNTLYFVTSISTALWRTDGTPEGTMPATEFTPGTISGIDSLTASNGTLFVVTHKSGTPMTYELWSVDPVARTTERLTTTVAGQPGNVTSCGGSTFFSDAGLWVTDGSASGTRLVKSVNIPYSAFVNRVCLGSTLYFSGSETATGAELWKSDGTEGGTVLVTDIYPGSPSSTPTSMGLLNGKFLFRATAPGSGDETWVSDGTANGTVLVKDINPGSGGYPSLNYMAVAGNLALFPAIDNVHGEEVWVTDGTPGNTFLWADINPGSGYSSSGNFTVLGNTLVFSAYDGSRIKLMAASLASAPYSLITSPTNGSVGSSSALRISGEAHSDSGSPIAGVEVSIDGGDTYIPATGTDSWSVDVTLPADGVYPIISRAADGAGNVEVTSTGNAVTFTLDRSPPTGSMSINNGASVTTSQQVTLDVTASAMDPGVDCNNSTPPYICGSLNARYSNDGTYWSAWETARTSKSWTVPSGDGEKTVYVQLRDRAGNVTDLSDKIALDKSNVPVSTIVAPAPGFSTKGYTVSVSGTAAPGPGGGTVTLVEVSRDGGSTWQSATGTTNWNITLNYPITGSYVIKSRARVGSFVETPSNGVMIIIDRTPPSGSISLYYGTWTLNANANDGGYCVMVYPNICGYLDMSTDGITWQPASTTPGTPGPLWLRDGAGNVSYIGVGGCTNTYGGPIQMLSSPTLYYSLLQQAYDAAPDGDLIKVSSALTEDITFSRNAAVTIRGGYSSNFSAVTGSTLVTGRVVVKAGSVAMENFEVSGAMTVDGGDVAIDSVTLR